jgi:hypothetical protein
MTPLSSASRTWDEGTRRSAIWAAVSVFWLMVLVLSVLTHSWPGVVTAGGLAAISGYRSYVAKRGSRPGDHPR